MTLFLADIASYQGGLALSRLRPDCVGVFVKATQGTSYVDPYYAGWRQQAQSAGLIFVAYHYVTTDAPAAQAQHIATTIADPGVPLMFDVEQASGNVAQALAVIKACKDAGLNPRVLYLPKWYWAQVGSPDLLPVAEYVKLTSSAYPTSQSGSPGGLYPGDSAAGWAAYGGVTPTFYQFTDAAIEGGQPVDMNAYRGTLEQLRADLGFAAPTQIYPPYPGYDLVYSAGRVELHTNDVSVWQKRMHGRGWSITVDGWYGPKSEVVCKAFQADSTAHNWPLTQDGVVGPLTWKASWLRPVSH
jgi:hypothetical protein